MATKRRKPVAERKTKNVNVRITAKQHAAIAAAAKRTGIPISSWVVMHLLRAAQAESGK